MFFADGGTFSTDFVTLVAAKALDFAAMDFLFVSAIGLLVAVVTLSVAVVMAFVGAAALIATFVLDVSAATETAVFDGIVAITTDTLFVESGLSLEVACPFFFRAIIPSVMAVMAPMSANIANEAPNQSTQFGCGRAGRAPLPSVAEVGGSGTLHCGALGERALPSVAEVGESCALHCGALGERALPSNAASSAGVCWSSIVFCSTA